MRNQVVIAQPTSCAICSTINEDLHDCRRCGEYICESCPANGCACVDQNPKINRLKRQIRAAAIERADLLTQGSLMGASSLTTDQQARVELLTGIVSSLQDEIDFIQFGADDVEYAVDEG